MRKKKMPAPQTVPLKSIESGTFFTCKWPPRSRSSVYLKDGEVYDGCVYWYDDIGILFEAHNLEAPVYPVPREMALELLGASSCSSK